MATQKVNNQLYVSGQALDGRVVKNNYSDIANIANAYVGMLVYVVNEDKYYKITSLTSLGKPNEYSEFKTSSSAYKPSGSKTVSQLTSSLLIETNLGNIYNITDSGTTTSDFVEGSGHPIASGANVVVVDISSTETPNYKFDLVGGFIDLSNYQPKITSSNKLSADFIQDGITNKTVTATEKTTWSNKQDALSQTQLDNIALGGTSIQPSNTAGLLKNNGEVDTTTQDKANNAIQMPSGGEVNKILEYDTTNGVKWADKPSNGKSAYQLYVDGGGELSPEDWLASLKANIGEFKFVANVPAVETAFEDATSGGIGAKYTQSIDNISAGQDTLSLILLMNTVNASPAKTYMIATQEAATAGTYEFIYAGDLQSAMPSNVLTRTNIINDLTTGGTTDVASAETVKDIANITLEKVYSGNILDPNLIKVSKIYNYTDDRFSNIPSAQQSLCYGCTDYIELPTDGVVVNWVLKLTGQDSQYKSISFFDENKNQLGFVNKNANGTLSVASEDYPSGAKYIVVNLGLSNSYDGYAIYNGTTLPEGGYSPYIEATYKLKNNGVFASGEKLADTHVVDNLDSDSATDVLSAKQGKELKEGVDTINTKLDGKDPIWDSLESLNLNGVTKWASTNDYEFKVIEVTNTDVVHIEFSKIGSNYSRCRLVIDKPLEGGQIDNLLSEGIAISKSETFDMSDYNFGQATVGYFLVYTLINTHAADSNILSVKVNDVEYRKPTKGLIEIVEELETNGGGGTNDLTECAIGVQNSYGTLQSELNASPIVDNSEEFNVGYTLKGKQRQKPVTDKIIMMSHDDGNLSDLIGVRKIYNKYNFHGSFCIVLSPFANLSDAKVEIANGRKLIEDGHEVGIHAIMANSYWFQNRMFDIRPDGTSNFAPTVADFNNPKSEGATINVFNDTLQSMQTTKVVSVYLKPSFGSTVIDSSIKDYWDEYLGSITQGHLDVVNSFYNLYGDIVLKDGVLDCEVDDIMTATDVTIASKTRLGWLEYWYNNLIDITLGYSSTESTLADRFAEDYSVPSGASLMDYYPDAAHILNGKMIYWEDTTNPNYANAKVKTASGFSDNDYQLVGKFTKGLFKDCFSTCNYEVMDREIAVATEFFRKYYHIDHFTDQHIHGTTYFTKTYFNTAGNRFVDRYNFVNEDMNGRMWSSRLGAYVSARTIMSEYGINICKETQYRHRMEYEGQIGNYYGVDKIKAVGCYGGTSGGNSSKFATDITTFLSMFGITTNTGQENMSYSTFMGIVNGIEEDWLKFCYKNTGQSNISVGDGTIKMVPDYLRSTLDHLFASVGTGKIPMLSFDTLNNNPAIMSAMDILLRACKKAGFEVVSFEEGSNHILSHPRSTAGNLFPNPTFQQNKWKLFDYDNTIALDTVKLPDGWYYYDGMPDIEVSYNQDLGSTVMTSAGAGKLITRIYGLPSGDYQLRYSAKGSDARIIVRAVKNGTKLTESEVAIDDYNLSTGWVDKTINIAIPEHNQKEVDYTNPASVACQGCENNVCAIEIVLYTTSGDSSCQFAKPKFYAV